MDGKISVSVIIPVWNVEPYIGECIDSLRGQTLDNMEYIFIDDCGQDKSMTIVERHAREDSRIRILRNSKNLGPGPSRNAGIEAAQGEYLGFVDPDDWVDAGFYEELYRTAIAGKYEIVKGIRAVSTGNSKKDKLVFAQRCADNQKAARLLASGISPIDCIFPQHQAAIYSRTFIIHHSIRNGTTRHAQDVTFFMNALYYVERVKVLEYPIHIYHYRKREKSATLLFDLQHYEDELSVKYEQINFIRNNLAQFNLGYWFCSGRLIELLYLHNHMKRDNMLSHLASGYIKSIRQLGLLLPNRWLLISQNKIIFFLMVFGVNYLYYMHGVHNILNKILACRYR